MSDSAGAAPRAWRAWIAVLAGAGVAWGGLSYVALTIGVLAEGYRYSLTDAAALATLELGAMALTTMTGGYLLQHLSVRQLAVLGGCTAAAANLLSAVVAPPAILAATRVAAGAGFGWMAAGLNTSVSRSPNPQRLFLHANFGCITAAAVFFAVMPEIYGRAGYRSYFVAYALLCAAAAVAMRWLPTSALTVRAARTDLRPLGAARLAVFGAVSTVWLCYAGVWSLTERVGREIGMTEEAVGHALGLSTLAGLLGAGVAAACEGRLNPLRPLLFTSLATGLCYVWFGYSDSPAAYTGSLCVWGVVFCPILAYAYAVATEIDPSGALGRLIGGGTAISTALGPTLGAAIAQRIGYAGVGIAAFAVTASACVAIAILVPRARQGNRALLPAT